MLIGILDACPGESASDLLGTPLAEFHDPDQPLLEIIVLRIDSEADKMYCLAIPCHGKLNSGYQPEMLMMFCCLQCIGDTCGRIMVRQRKNLDSGCYRMVHEFCGCQGAVGGCRMCVKIVNEAHKAHFN